jgi:hypothetical protein
MARIKELAILFLLGTFALAAHAGVTPPHSSGFGKTLGDWQLAYWTATLNADGPEQDLYVLFLPLPDGEFNPTTGNVEGELAIEYGQGTAFFLPIFVFIGESYVQMVPDDMPADFEGIFLDNPGLTAQITVDGNSLIDSNTDDLSDFYSGPVFFDPPITEGYPVHRDVDLDAAAAIWVEGLGFAQPPLFVGEHTLHLLVDTGLGFGFDNTWHIMVTP